jgi:asparaginyl-tRNA synthetase
MIEPELAFADLRDDMACATAYLQYVVCYTPQGSLVLDWRK